MTTTMDFNTELISIQNELKKCIFHHQLLRLNNKKPDESVKTKLISFENKIVELSKRQKVVVNNLRKERLNASNLDNQLIPNKPIYLNNQSNILKQRTNSTPIRSFNKKLLIPVSAAAATSKKINHQQILVVPTPGGGARLATTSTTTSRPTITKSSSNGYSTAGNSLIHAANKTQFNNFTITNTTKPITTSVSLSTIRLINDKTNTTSTNSILSGELTTLPAKKKGNTQTIEKSPPQQEMTIAPLINKLEPKIDETKAKEDYFSKLGLVTKQALSEIQNKKSERKRRTTANPQFSNAAIEAKRISAQEMAAKRANRKRELAASNQDNLTSSNNNSSTGNKQQKSILNSNRNKVVGGSNGKQDRKTTAPKVSTSNNNNNKQFSQSNELIKISSNCFVCDEVCDSDLDEIMFCEDCHCLFHVTCSSTIDRIKKTMGVPCPKCERKRSLAEQLPGLNQTNDNRNVLKQKALDSSNSNSSSVVSNRTNSCRRRLDRSKNGQNKNSKFVENSTKTDQTSNKTGNKVLTENGKSAIEPKSDEERYKFLLRYESLDRQVRDFRVKLALLKDKVYSSKESRREILLKKESSKRSIDSIINLVKKIQECNCEQKENQQINNQCKLDEKLSNEVMVVSEPTNTSNELTILDSNEQVVLNEVALNEEVISNNESNDSQSKVEKEQSNDVNMLGETDETVNNLNTLNVDNETNETVQQTELVLKEDNIQQEHKIKDEDKRSDETQIKLSNNQQLNCNETKRLIIKMELIEKNELINQDEPPNKKIRLSPTKEEVQVSKEEFEVCQVSQDLDEVSAAIASIQN